MLPYSSPRVSLWLIPGGGVEKNNLPTGREHILGALVDVKCAKQSRDCQISGDFEHNAYATIFNLDEQHDSLNYLYLLAGQTFKSWVIAGAY